MSFREHHGVAAAEHLQRSLRRGRLAHAYLVVGPRGSGKEALARTLAKAVNCETASADSCDRCESCRRVEDGSHPDVHWIRPESKTRRIQIEQMREFTRTVGLAAQCGGVKVGIVVDADCLSEEAANAFLKTLEEPPGQTVIVLLTTQPQRLLPTILSRCVRLTVGERTQGVSPYRAKVVELLREWRGDDGNRVVAAYRLMRELTTWLGQVREQIEREVSQQIAHWDYEELDAKTRERMREQWEARVEGEYRAARDEVLEQIYAWFGDVWLWTQQAAEGMLALPECAAATREVAERIGCEQAEANLDALEQIREAWQRNVPELLAWEVGLLKLVP